MGAVLHPADVQLRTALTDLSTRYQEAIDACRRLLDALEGGSSVGVGPQDPSAPASAPAGTTATGATPR